MSKFSKYLSNWELKIEFGDQNIQNVQNIKSKNCPQCSKSQNLNLLLVQLSWNQVTFYLNTTNSAINTIRNA